MNPFVLAYRKLTYRNEHTNPDPNGGLHITADRWSARTVHDPRVHVHLAARRVRVLREGLDPLDRALLDPETVALLRADLERASQWTTSYLRRNPNPGDQQTSRPLAKAIS
jgi:hypothetical protein